jgi:hypothetical protein
MAFIYLLGVVWMPLHTHFCGTKLTELHFFTGELHEDNCDCSEMGGSDCCSDRVIKLEQKAENIIANVIQSPRNNFSHNYLFPQPRIGLIDSSFGQKVINKGKKKIPPILGRTHLELSVFRI